MGKKSTAVGFLVFGGLFLQYMMRTTIAIAIPAAVQGYHGLYTNLEDIIFRWRGGSSKLQLNYTQVEVGAIFGTFYIGYIPSRLLGGHLAFRFPALRVFQLSLLMTSLLHIWAPVGLGVHLSVIIIIRILRGFTEGIAFPAAFTLLVEWLPTFTADRARIITTVPIVMYLGFGLGFLLNSLFLPLFGWFAPFALFGIFGILWTAIMETFNCVYGFTQGPTEDDMKDMNKNRKSSIENQYNGRRISNNTPIPWTAMMTSPAVLAVVFCEAVLKCGQHLVLLYAPIMFSQVGKRSITEIGLLSMSPPLLVAFILPIALVIIPSLNLVDPPRKIFNSIGFFGFAAGLMVVGMKPNFIWMTVFLAVGLGMTAFALAAGYNMTPIEIAPEYATIIRGVSAAFGTAIGAFYIIFVGWATGDKTTNQWSIVCVLEACFLCAAAVLFMISGRSTVQPWARPWERNGEPPRPQLRDTASADRLVSPAGSLNDLLEATSQECVQPDMDDYYTAFKKGQEKTE
ncbi:PREDICTED: vesicular glutamate transporter 2-like [Branchiostoma belcheri]|uniref:Vesicular glutamate transporter 2-like n=1 Tax=Branchiostoma belcheri TaxID=7741 RepID=A0A6P4ZMU2_BRABE|nr:PREDICTED: vesicular glutamate transporter 2-like [Branchiostoma belcheri]